MLVFIVAVAASHLAAAVNAEDGAAATPSVARRATSSLTDSDIEQLRAAWSTLSTSKNFTSLVSDPFASHGTAAFLPWHRRSLNRFEDLMKVALPYWDFSLEPIPALAQEPRTRAGAANALYSDKRRPASPYPTETFLKLEVMAFAQLDFTQLSLQLENLFETVLASLGGDLATLDSAPRDILYWLTLANVDRIWWRWSLNHNATSAPPSATHELKDMEGPFSGALVVNDSSRWDPLGNYRDALARRAGNPDQAPTDGHIDGYDLNMSEGAHVAMLMRAGHIQSHLGDSAFSADNSERSYQGLIVTGTNGSQPAVAGLGMTTTDNHEWHTEDVPAPNISSQTAWDTQGQFSGSAPDGGAIHGLDGDPVPPTGNRLDETGTSGNSMPGPTAQTDVRGGKGSSNTTALRMKGTTGKQPAPDGKTYNSIANNVTHYADRKDNKDGDTRVVASVAFSFAGNWGFHNSSSPPMYMSSTSALPMKAYSSATHSLAIQQDTMDGSLKKRPTSVEVPTPPPPSPNATYPYDTVSELFASPPKMHMILSLCEVPVTESPYRVEIVVKNTVIGQIFIEGLGGLRNKWQRDRPCDITEGYQALLKKVPLDRVQDELMILMYHGKTGKMVKTPKFTVRLDQYVF